MTLVNCGAKKTSVLLCEKSVALQRKILMRVSDWSKLQP